MRKGMLAVLSAMVAFTAFSQTERFNFINFTPPAGWQRLDLQGNPAYSHKNPGQEPASFCMITFYPAITSEASPSENFAAAWKQLVELPNKAPVLPAERTENRDEGWTLNSGTADLTTPQGHYHTILATFSGYGKTLSLQVNYATDDYLPEIETFFRNLHPDTPPILDGTSPEHNINAAPMNNEIATFGPYEFIPPRNWTVTQQTGQVALQNPSSGCLILLLGLQDSSGNLEQDARTVFELMYSGWQIQPTAQHPYVLTKGNLARGLEYCMLEAPMALTHPDGRYDTEDGAALVVGAGRQIAIISIRHSSLLGHSDCLNKYETWRRFFNSFDVPDAPHPAIPDDFAERIVGIWKMTESRALSEYRFAANSQYANANALGSSHTTTDGSSDYLHLKTYSFEGDGSYHIQGNQLSFLKNGEAQPETATFRFEKVNYGGTNWNDRLYLLKSDAAGQNEVCYEKQDQ